ncbi:TonB-system energizer ExbB [uncultured Cocleimonas sp.]|uniref:TonB-system energizer ExbB n=1 Tax=uncultured Cocleimonas sp. TaxID=1051587 RepID=UPI00345B29D5
MIEFLKVNLDYGIFGILGLMSVIIVWFALERWIYYIRVKTHTFDIEEDLQISLTRGLTTISSIGVNAPYIGLLGTVLGILITFNDLGKGGEIDTSAIMLGLSLALKATAGGLLVAIPAIMIYNALLRKVDIITTRWKKENHQQSCLVDSTRANRTGDAKNASV